MFECLSQHEDFDCAGLSIPLVSPLVWLVENPTLLSFLLKMFPLFIMLAPGPWSSFTIPLNVCKNPHIMLVHVCVYPAVLQFSCCFWFLCPRPFHPPAMSVHVLIFPFNTSSQLSLSLILSDYSRFAPCLFWSPNDCSSHLLFSSDVKCKIPMSCDARYVSQQNTIPNAERRGVEGGYGLKMRWCSWRMRERKTLQ